MIEWQGPSWVFVGNRPKDLAGIFRNYNLVTGSSAINLAKDRHGNSAFRRGRSALTSRNKHRGLKLMSIYAKGGALIHLVGRMMFYVADLAERSLPLGPTRLDEACLLMRELITEEGDKGYRKSKTRCFIEVDGEKKKKVTDVFSFPIEDFIPILSRDAKAMSFLRTSAWPSSSVPTSVQRSQTGPDSYAAKLVMRPK